MNLTARQWSFTAATRIRINRNPHSGDPQDWVDCRGSQPAAGAAMESCRSFPEEGGRDPWRLAWNGCDLGRHRNLQSLSARRYDVFNLSRVAGLRLSGGGRYSTSQRPGGSCLKQIDSNGTPAIGCCAWCHINHLVSPGI